MGTEDRQVYISYAWGGESERIVNELDADLQTNGITIIRDKRNLGYKGKISDFMQEIGRGHAVIVVISDKYLKSPNCMYELVEIAKNKDIHDRIFPIVLSDADIYNPVNRIKYIKHWEDKLKELDEAMRSVSSANLAGMREEIDSYDEIRDNISNLTFTLKDMNTLTPEMHEGGNFSTLISEIKQRLGDAGTPQKPAPKPVEKEKEQEKEKEKPAKAVKEAPQPAKPSKPPKTEEEGKFAPYLEKVVSALTDDEYTELEDERFGKLRFNRAFQKKTNFNFLGKLDEYHQFVILEQGELDKKRFAELADEITAYNKAVSKKKSCWHYTVGLILVDSISDEVTDLVFEAQAPKLGFLDLYATMIVIYSLAENDIFYPKVLPDGHNSKFEDKLKLIMP